MQGTGTMNEEHIIRLGACGQIVLDMIDAASRNTWSDWPWGWNRDWFIRLPDGEAVYDTSRETLNSYFKSPSARKGFSDAERTMFRRKLSRCIWKAFCAARRMTLLELLKSSCRDKPAVLEHRFTIGQCCLFYDILLGRKAETILKRYTGEELEAVVSSKEENVLKIEALQVLMDETEKLKKERAEEIMKLHEEISNREKALKAKYKEKLDRLQQQIEETRNGK